MHPDQQHDFAIEYRLKELNPALHRSFTNAVFFLQHTLQHYRLFFPEFTDHSILHSLNVLRFCNELTGPQITRLNADELYILLMACYLHDTGMGISLKDYEQFSREIDFGNYFETHSRENTAAVIRDFHHEFSGLLIRKYADFFEIPSEAHLQAIVQTARGHRRTDLNDEKEYPVYMTVPGGSTVCLPYLSALIRLADEIDVCADRNPFLLYGLEKVKDPVQIVERKKAEAVKALRITEKAFTLLADGSDGQILEALRRMTEKMQRTLDESRRAIAYRTPFVISQEQVLLEILPDPAAG